MQQNKELDIARFIVEKTDSNLFLTGKAGTGKSTFIREIVKHTKKRCVLLAPTGVAAVNIGGMTIHSFFWMDFAPFLPGTFHNEPSISPNRAELIRNLDLIIIDEISMVRADVLDQIDYILRYVRGVNKAFGGVQMLMVGDLLQLAPIAEKDVAEILRTEYDTFHFFNSRVLRDSHYYCVNLENVYRQTDETFIEILNRARFGNVTDTDIQILNNRYVNSYTPTIEDRFITLVTHNAICDKINAAEMSKLHGERRQYDATITGSFPKADYPTHSQLSLIVGSRVMFIKNDPNREYFNGALGTILSFNDDTIEVTLDDGSDVVLSKVTWDMTEYKYNKVAKKVESQIIGQFTQFPIKPAWAITVHKSQGMTFDKIVIDVKSAFAEGQAYVALSRCRSLNGVILKNKVSKGLFTVDLAAKNFMNYKIADVNELAEKINFEPFYYQDNIESEDIVDPALIAALKKWRLTEAHARNVPAFYILGDKTLNAIALAKPLSLQALKNVKGIGPHKLNEYGEDIIDVVKDFFSSDSSSVELDNVTTVDERPVKKKTGEITYEMFRSGLNMQDIAQSRQLTRGTIINHLTQYVKTGEINPCELVDNITIEKILSCLPSLPDGYGSTDLFNALSGEVSYDDIRICLSSPNFAKNISPVKKNPIEAIWSILQGEDFSFWANEILVYKEDYYQETLEGYYALKLWRYNDPTIHIDFSQSSGLDRLNLSKLKSAVIYVSDDAWMMNPESEADFFEVQKQFGWEESGLLALTISSKNNYLSIIIEALSSDGYRYILRTTDTKY